MSDSLADLKQRCRREMRESLARLSAAEREADSARLRARLASSPPWRSAGSILGFVATPAEPDLGPLLAEAARAGRRICLPRWNEIRGAYEPAVLAADGSLVRGPFRIPEPGPEAAGVPVEQLDLILVPGLAFDRFGRRLGRGGGHYDRLLAGAARARRCGVGFDRQIVPSVPAEPHDVNLHFLVTPGLWLSLPDRAGD